MTYDSDMRTNITKQYFYECVAKTSLDDTIEMIKIQFNIKSNFTFHFDKNEKLNLTLNKRLPKNKAIREAIIKKAVRAQRRERNKPKIERNAQALRNNLPKSEVWFHSKYFNKLSIKGDDHNVPWNKIYIPDIINTKFKYVIEIDGSIHDLAEVKVKDRQKEVSFMSQGFVVFRVKAYDEEDFTYKIHRLSQLRIIFQAYMIHILTLYGMN